jgi:hypothetical protein
MKNFLLIAQIILVSSFIQGCSQPSPKKQMFDPARFADPPASVKVHTWWHWLDGAVTKEGITKDLESMKKQGIGQATILNIGLFNGKDFGVKRVVFNSPEWHELFLWALKEANRLGITIGAHNCDGWSTSGGPWITPEMSMKRITWSKTYVSGGTNGPLSLKQPYSEWSFYRDVAVLAYRTDRKSNSFSQAKPACKLNGKSVNDILNDGDPMSTVWVHAGDRIDLVFSEDFTADRISIMPHKTFSWSDMNSVVSAFDVSVSSDGKNYRKIASPEIRGLNESFIKDIPSVSSRFWRIEITDIKEHGSHTDFTLSELELLGKDESPSYFSAIPQLQAKSVAVKPAGRTDFDFTAHDGGAAPLDKEGITDLTSQMNEKGELEWTVPEGNWCILRFGYTTTGAMNSPSTAEGRGFECDKMDSSALNVHFAGFPQKLVATAGEYTGNTFKFLLIDSWECNYQNWTAAFPEAFEKTRGYNITRWIPVLCGETVGSQEQSEAFLYDFRKTIADLIENNYYRHFADLCHRNKLELHAEIIYGDANYPPLEILRTNSYPDLPMFEFWASHNRNTFTEYTPSGPFESFPVFAASAYGKKVVGSEAYTGMAHYSEAPADLKHFGDRAFCSGINQMILHSYVQQPLDKQPGMTLGPYSAHFNRNNPYWNHTSGWLKYQSRVQYILQEGTIASNILYYIGDQLPQYIENPAVSELPFGYRAMACNFDMLKEKAIVKQGRILLGNGIAYEMLILPASTAMELKTLKRIDELVAAGAIVCGPRPERPYSMSGVNESKEFDELLNKLWPKEQVNTEGHKCGRGKVYNQFCIAQILRENAIKPEFSTNSSDSMNLIYIHKKAGDTDIYFVSNQTDRELSQECCFAAGMRAPELWDPMDGTVRHPAVFIEKNGTVILPLTFGPGSSVFVVFSDPVPRKYFCNISSGEKQVFPSGKTEGDGSPVPEVVFKGDEFGFTSGITGDFRFTTSQGEKILKHIIAPAITEVKDFSCLMDFSPAYAETLKPITVSDLKPLNEFSDPQIRYFAGEVKYTLSFTLDDSILNRGRELKLDIGNFGSVADITLNGTAIGISWFPGTRYTVTGNLKQKNILEITVADVFRNRIIGDFSQYGALKNVWTSAPVYEFLDKDKPLKTAGLCGPIRIIEL